MWVVSAEIEEKWFFRIENLFTVFCHFYSISRIGFIYFVEMIYGFRGYMIFAYSTCKIPIL